MKPRRTPTSNKVFQLPGGTEDNDLWVTTALEDGEPTVTSTWELTDEERELIADGGTIDLTVWGSGTPPVAMAVGVPLEERDRG